MKKGYKEDHRWLKVSTNNKGQKSDLEQKLNLQPPTKLPLHHLPVTNGPIGSWCSGPNRNYYRSLSPKVNWASEWYPEGKYTS